MIPVSEIEKARTRWDIIAAEVPVKRRGREWVGICPFHREKSPSFAIVPDKGFAHCFGCGWHGDAVAFLMQTRNLTFLDAVRELLDLPAQRPKEAALANNAKSEQPGGQPEREVEVAEILAGCGPVTDTTAAWLYLYLRGLGTRQPELLAHPSLYCHETRQQMQAMVAPIRNRDRVATAVMRFYLKPAMVVFGGDSSPSDNRADVKARKKTLGPMGDGAVQLAPAGRRLGLAEGVETALAAHRRYNLPVWAICGTARFGFPAHWRETHPPAGERARVWIPPDRPPRDVEAHQVDERAPSVWVPSSVEQLVIFGDRGLAGETCAVHAADWWTRHGLPATAVFPGEGFGDFNDELLGLRS